MQQDSHCTSAMHGCWNRDRSLLRLH